MKRILVTGAGGFVGGHLVPYLASRGHAVVAVTRQSARRFDGHNVTTAILPESDAAWIEVLSGIDAVVHLAGLAHEPGSAERHDEINRRLTARIAGAAARSRVAHFIFVSSIAAQIGPAAARIVIENDEPHPGGAYGVAKLAAETEVANSGVPFTVLRPVVIDGPDAKGNAALLGRIARLPLPMPFGQLTSKRSMLSIENFNSAISTVLFNPKAMGEIFIVADPDPKTVGEIIAAARTKAGRPAWMFDVDPRYLKLALRLMRREELWDRVGASLVADPAKLLSIGWTPEWHER